LANGVEGTWGQVGRFATLLVLTQIKCVSLANQKGIIMKWTTLTFKQLAAQKTLRLDPKYWIKRQAASDKPQATSLPQLDGKLQAKQKGKRCK
jgi:hypothetical protein